MKLGLIQTQFLCKSVTIVYVLKTGNLIKTEVETVVFDARWSALSTKYSGVCLGRKCAKKSICNQVTICSWEWSGIGMDMN